MLRHLLPIALVLAGCVADVASEEAGVLPDGDEDSALVPAAAGSPQRLNIGFNGEPGQFAYYPDWAKANTVQPGPRLCHTYVGWAIGNQKPHTGDPTSEGARAYLDTWLAAAEGHCDEALISFKAESHHAPPSEHDYARSIDALVASDWKTEAGFTGNVSYTPWNEPNNKADAGDGLGVEIAPELAAHYYLALEKACRAHGCKVGAGDFASNGTMWEAFSWNCSNDNVAPGELCAHASSENPTGAPASYLDRYKNTIANDAKRYGLGSEFRPEFFAFHGWHDINGYIDHGNHCADYSDCGVRRLLKSLGASWGSVKLWDTEAGVGQTSAPDDHDQACAAAFLIRIHTISPRIERLYITRLHFGDGELVRGGHTARPALDVLARRATTYAANCR